MAHYHDLQIKLFMDGAEIEGMRSAVASMPHIKGFTTNPTLMRKAGITDYTAFAKDVIKAVGGMPISFEVFSDEFEEMEREGRIIHSWGPNASIKIPVTNTRAESAAPLIRQLSSEGVPLNVTAILTLDQVREVTEALDPNTPSIVSVFAGRVADAGVDPVPADARSCRDPEEPAEGRIALGEPSGGAERDPGRRDGLPHHHRDQGYPGQAAPARQGPDRVLARHGENVLE